MKIKQEEHQQFRQEIFDLISSGENLESLKKLKSRIKFLKNKGYDRMLTHEYLKMIDGRKIYLNINTIKNWKWFLNEILIDVDREVEYF